MQKILRLATPIFLLAPLLMYSQTGFAESYENPIFGYTHLLPSPLTLPGGRLVLGTEASYGVFDSLQIGTGLLQDIYQVYNVNMKLNFVDSERFALGTFVSFQTYNLKNVDSGNPDLNVTTWRPGLVAGYELVPQLAIFAGGNLNISDQNLKTSGVVTSGYVQGAELESDLAWAYNPGKKKLGNVLSGGMSYDLTYKLAGFGISHHWRSFKIGVHYYPNADKNKLLPMLAGGTSVDF